MSSHSDISMVLKALDEAEARLPFNWGKEEPDEETFEQMMELEYNEKPLSEHLGVSKKIFPQVEELEDDEIKELVEKILDVWDAYHYYADLPEGLPIRIAYTTLLSVWDETVMSCPIGRFHFDFYNLELEQYVNPDYKKMEEFPF